MNFFNWIIIYENLLQTLRIWYYYNISICWIIWAVIILGGTTKIVKKNSWLTKLVFWHSFHLATGKKWLERSFGRSIQSYSLESFFSRKIATHVLILNWLKSTPFPLFGFILRFSILLLSFSFSFNFPTRMNKNEEINWSSNAIPSVNLKLITCSTRVYLIWDISKFPSNSAVVFKVMFNYASLQNCSNSFLPVPDCSCTANSNLKKNL